MAYFKLDFLFPDARSLEGSSWVELDKRPDEERGKLHITNHCARFSELEFEINRMIKELEGIKIKARREYEKVDKQ